MTLVSAVLSAVLADSINDVSSTRKVYLLATGLALLGVLLIVVTVWFWRTTRHDPELLAPLETMGTKKFRSRDSATQQTMLDTARPADAQPMKWGLVRGDSSPNTDVNLPAPAESVAPAVAAVATGTAAVAAADDVDRDQAVAVAPVVSTLETDAAPQRPVNDLEVEEHVAVQPVAGDFPDSHVNGNRTDGSPFVIVPLDHDLVPDRDPAPAPVAERAVDVHDDDASEPNETSKPAIDPLLRMFEGS